MSEISTKKALDKRGKSSKKSFRTESQWDDWEDESEIERKKGSENDARVEIIMCQVKSLLIGLTDDLIPDNILWRLANQKSIFSFQCINHSQNTSNNLHNLAEIHGLVDVSIPDKTIYHKLYSPKLQILFDDKLRDIANSIAILQDASSTLTSTSDFEDSDSNNNNNMNQFSSLLSIRNDLLLNSDIKQSLERSKLLLTNASK
eukprot:gene2750-5417_t